MSALLERVKSTYPWDEVVLDTGDERIIIDDTYQREEEKDLVRRIVAEGFDLTRAGYLLTNQRTTGEIAIIDGQQRLRAARELGESEVLAMLLSGMDVEGEADLYCDVNENRKPLNALQRFKGAFASRKPWARAIHEIVRSYGAGISKVDSTNGPQLVAISAIRDIYARGGDVELRGTFDVVREAFGAITRDTTHANFLRGVHLMICRHPDLDRHRLAKKIGEHGMIAMRTRAAALDRGSASARGFYLVMVDEYNHRLPAKRKIDPKLRG